MIKLITAKGTEIMCDAVVKGAQYPVLHIYTNEITPIQAYQIFGDPEATKTLTAISIEYEQNPDFVPGGDQEEYLPVEVTKVYHDFTEIYSVQKSTLIPGDNEIMIWLQRPIDNYD